MEKSMSVLKRLLAMLLVFALVVGYMPVSVFAEEDASTTQPEKTSLSAEITREKIEIPEENPEETPEENPEETPEENPEETPEENPEETPEENPEETPEENPEETPEENPEENPEETPEENPEETPEETPDMSLEAQSRIRSSASAPSENPDNADDTDDTTEYVYTYTVVVKDGESEVEPTNSNYTVVWKYLDENGVETEIEDTDPTTPNVLENVEQDNVTAEIAYNGVVITLTYAEGGANAITVSASKDANMVTTATVGVPFNLPQGTLVANVDGLTHNVTVSENAQKHGDNQAYATEEGTVTITETWTANDVVYASNTYTVNASYPEATLSVEGDAEADTEKWYDAEQTVAVKVNSNSLELVQASYLPTVTVGDTAYTAWNEVDGVWTMEVPVAETATVTYAPNTSVANSLNVNIDAKEPTFGEVSYAYNEGELTFVYFTYSVGSSGLKSLVINDKPFEANENNLYSVEKSDSVKVVVTSNAGKSSTLDITNIKSDLNAVITYPELDNGEGGTLDGTTYYVVAGKSIMLQVENADDGIYNKAPATTVKDANGNVLTLSEAGWTYTDGKWIAYIPITDVVYGVQLHFVDGRGRVVEKTGDRTYIVDTSKPVITIDAVTVANDTGSIQYVADAFNYVIRVKDVNLGENNGSIQLSFNKNGSVHNYSLSDFAYANGEYTYTIPMAHGDTLTNVSVTATDNTSNTDSVTELTDATIVVDTEAPMISAWLGSNVTHLYENNNGMFAVIDETAGADVTVYVSITDDNLDEAAVAAFMEGEGWNYVGGNWTKTLTVEEHQTGTMNFTFMAKDMNGRYHKDTVALTLQQTEGRAVVNSLNLDPLTAEDGSVTYTVDLNLDRRAPGNGSEETAPEITLAIKSGVYVSAQAGEQTIELYNGAPVFLLYVTDTSKQGVDSGLQKVEWKFSDADSFVQATSDVLPFEDGKFTLSTEIPVTINGTGESNGAKLEISVYDHAGNVTTYTKFFGVDNQIPVVNPEPIFDDGDTEFTGSIYDHTRSTKFTISDLNLAEYKVTINGVEQTGILNEEKTSVEYNLAFTENTEYIVTITAADKNGNPYEKTYTFTVDTTNPVVTVEKETSANVTSTETGVDYHDGIVTYNVTVEDANLDHGTVVVNVYYQDAPSEAIEVIMSGGDEDGPDVYTGSFTIEDDGKVLTGISIDVVDDAGRRPDEVVVIGDENGFTKGEDGIWNYSGNAVVVDMTAPEIHVEKTTAEDGYVQTYDDRDYYNSDVTYTVTVKDMYLEDNQVIVVYVLYQGNDVAEPVDMIHEAQVSTELLNDEDICKGSFTVTDGKLVESIVIEVVDSTGLRVNEAQNNLTVTDTDNLTSFEFNSETQKWRYTGNHIVVDTTDPVAEMTFSDNVHSFYRNGDMIYFVLATPFTAKSGTEFDPVTAETQEVTVTLTVTDNNLALDNDPDVKSMKANEELPYGWEGTTAVNTSSTVTYTATSGQIGPDGIVAFQLDVNMMDLAGRVPAAFTSKTTGDEKDFLDVAPDKDGHVAFNFVLDRERPSSGKNDNEAPVITVTPVLPEGIKQTETADGLDLFNGAFTFDLSVSDGYQENNINSGVKYVKWTVTDDNGVVEGYESGEKLNPDGKYSISVPLAGDPGESNEVVLQIWAEDNVGNLMTYKKTFGVDTQAPRISVTFTGDTATNGYFFNGDRHVKVTIEDLNLVQNLEDIEVLINELQQLLESDLSTSIVYEHDFTSNGEFQMQVNALDRAGWTNANTPAFFIMDYDAPSVTVTKESEGYNQSSATVDYYNKNVTYTVTVTDAYLSNNPGETDVQVADFTYTLEDGEGNEVTLPASAEGWTKGENDTYTYSFTVTDGQVLTGMTLAATDNAGNPMTDVVINDEDGLTTFEKIDGVWTYTGKQVAVDTTDPVVTVTEVIEEGKKYIQTYEGYDYYNGAVTYTVEVTDNFMNANLGTAEIVVTYLDGTVEIVDMLEGLMSMAEGLEVDAETYSFDIVVNNDKVLTDISINVEDNAGNTPAEVKVVEGDDKALTKFVPVEESTVYVYEGNGVVSDSVKPEVTLEFSDNVKSFYYNTKNNTIYVILNTPSVGASGEALVQDPQDVYVTITVKDKNLTLDSENVNGMQAKVYAWSGETPVNEETTITLVATSTRVNTDGTTAFIIDAGIIDLAGNIPEDFTSETTNDGETVLEVDLDENGRINYNVSLDRLRPSSGKADVTAPTIEVVPVNIEPTTTADGLDLFANAFQFALHITDGVESIQNSGVKYVKWTVTDENGVVANKAYEVDYSVDGAPIYAEDYLVDVALAIAAGESNEVTLNIVAEDFVGNRITFEKVFGVDNLAPRVTITQSNHSAQNDFYFNQDQIITVEIEDLNFESTTSTVTTEVDFNGWQSVGNNVYRTVLTYNVDGDYTFEMATTDRANNEATIDYTTGLVALQSFTIDKTAPIINVTYNPAVPVDTDGNAVQYFDANRTVTVTITEHNFRAADVNADLGAANALNYWATTGDIHTASDTFVEGNGYNVSIAYTDLAGNPAVAYDSPTFSVDLTAPTITMTQGSVQNGQPIADDLVLGYTINDAQDNLKNFTVEVLFLDSNFQLRKVEGVEYYTVTDGDRTNGYVDFTNIAAEKLNDGIYTVRITALDYAGHVVNLTPDLVFSLNRFGSTFTVADTYTEGFLTADATGVIYRNEVSSDLVIKEINPDRVWQDADHTVEGSAITISVNGNAVTLENGVDYEVAVAEMGTGGEKWYEYTYTIKSSVFQNNNELVDGEYTIFFYSEDEAGNKNSNESNEGSALQLGAEGTYSGKVSFTLDHKAPVVTILGIEAGEEYFEANKSVEINISDNTPVSISVYVNDELVEVVEVADGQAVTSDWIYYDETTGSYMLNLSEKNVPQNVRVVVTDAAGNEIVTELDDIMLTEDLWYQYINSLPAVLTSIVGLIGLIILIIVLIKKRKKNPTEEAAQV